MRTLRIAHALASGSSTPVDASSTPFHIGNEVAVLVTTDSGSAGNTVWVIEGNNEPDGSTAVWEELTMQMAEAHTHLHTITVYRQLRLTKLSGSPGKTATAYIMGGT